MVRRILALDQNGLTGFSWTEDLCETTRWSSTVDFRKEGFRAQRLRAFGAWLDARIRRTKPDLVLYEEPNENRKHTFQTRLSIMGYALMVEVVCVTLDVPFRCVPSRALKRFATGNGNAKKPDMVAAAEARGWTVRDDNEADALWVLEWGIHQIRAGEIAL